MSDYETIAVPMHVLPDGRKAITLTAYVEHDWVKQFVRGWPDYWRFDFETDCFVSPLLNEPSNIPTQEG